MSTVAGGAMSAASSLYQGGVASNEANYRAQVANNNAMIANRNADYAIAAGGAKTEAEARKGAAQAGRIKAAQAASGIDINTGSAVDVQAGQREINKLDTETIASNAQLEAYGYRTNAQNFKTESQLDEAEAGYAKTGSELKAAAGLLGSASATGSKWTSMGPGGSGGG